MKKDFAKKLKHLDFEAVHLYLIKSVDFHQEKMQVWKQKLSPSSGGKNIPKTREICLGFQINLEFIRIPYTLRRILSISLVVVPRIVT